MLKKLLKYDMNAIWKTARLLYPIELFLAIILGLSLHFIFNKSILEFFEYNLISFSLVLIALAALIGIIAINIIVYLLVYYRFYATFYTDQGYLTFSLPISRKNLLLEKVLLGLIWHAISTVCIIAVTAIVLALAPPFTVDGAFGFYGYAAWGDIISRLITESEGWIFLQIPAYIIGEFLYGSLGFLFVYLCITLGAVIFKKRKLLGGVGIYFGISTALSMTVEIAVYIIAGLLRNNAAVSEWVANLSAMKSNLLTFGASLIFIAILAAIDYLIYRITLNLIQKKLNLP